VVAPRQATVELAGRTFRVALSANHRPSRLEVSDDRDHIRISVRAAPVRSGRAPVTLDVNWTEQIPAARTAPKRGQCPGAGRRRGAVRRTVFSVTSEVPLGRRAVLGQVDRQAGRPLQLALTLR
jgi:hypothetical protein